MSEGAPDSRSKLLAAAAEEFARHGPRGARVAEIVRRAGVNERMIYHHFGSKDGLYQAVMEDQGMNLREQWLPYLRRAAAQISPADGLRIAYQGYYRAFHARPLLGALLMHEATTGWAVRPHLTVAMLPVELRELYHRAQEASVIRVDITIPVFHATAIAALTSAPSVRGLLAEHGDEVGDQIVELLLHGMIKQGGEHDGHGGTDRGGGADRADAGG